MVDITRRLLLPPPLNRPGLWCGKATTTTAPPPPPPTLLEAIPLEEDEEEDEEEDDDDDDDDDDDNEEEEEEDEKDDASGAAKISSPAPRLNPKRLLFALPTLPTLLTGFRISDRCVATPPAPIP